MNPNLWSLLSLQRGGGREEAEGGDRAAEEGGGGPGGQVPRGGEDQSRRGELVSFGKRRPGLNQSINQGMQAKRELDSTDGKGQV